LNGFCKDEINSQCLEDAYAMVHFAKIQKINFGNQNLKAFDIVSKDADTAVKSESATD